MSDSSALALKSHHLPYWFGLAAGLLGLSLLWTGLFWSQLGHPLPETGWMAEVYAVKRAHAKALPSPKVLVLAGSNALFSLDSGLLEADWGRPVVNLGVNAALGLDYLLRTAEPLLQPGDLVVMPLEYPLYQGDRFLNAQLIDYVIGQDPGYWRSLPFFERLSFIAQVPAARLIAGLRPPVESPPTPSGLYRAQYLDARGDYTHNDWSQLTAAERVIAEQAHAQARLKRHTYGRDDRADAPGWQRLRAFHQQLQRRGIGLWMVPPALMDQPSYHTDSVERHYYETLPERVRALGIPFFWDPYACMYPPEDFFDTPYHLTAAARTRHTRSLIAQLPSPP
ncbi:hypothetical protein GWK36_00935 [Caldichromatium japonicum]|uniref:Uncharacterized protein n=1 Tax=Caldichromatium japonicum TaxID=2699430 RepID=A0A6G7VAI1_9GAMM|nr:hypothetical protein [Caldichromatium japonicum]QIK36797.1 hypothetical protein GWK36_00935 [Caldichromatium japonicum]